MRFSMEKNSNCLKVSLNCFFDTAAFNSSFHYGNGWKKQGFYGGSKRTLTVQKMPKFDCFSQKHCNRGTSRTSSFEPFLIGNRVETQLPKWYQGQKTQLRFGFMQFSPILTEFDFVVDGKTFANQSFLNDVHDNFLQFPSKVRQGRFPLWIYCCTSYDWSLKNSKQKKQIAEWPSWDPLKSYDKN